MKAQLFTFTFNINGVEYSVVAESKFAAKKKLSRMADVPDGPRFLVRTLEHCYFTTVVKEEV